jgi:uracil-DNA glycosylase
MSLTREDMLRELELLPVWRLNSPLDRPADTPLEVKQEAVPNDDQVAPPIETAVSVVAKPKVETKLEAEVASEGVVEEEKLIPQELESQSPALFDVANMDWAELKQHVVGSGDQNADWVFVDEDHAEGDAGALLDKMLIAIQLQRGKNVYLTPLSAPNYFNRQIALIQPKLIVVFGEKAAQSLLGSNEPLDDLRGKIHQYQGVSVVVSYAPAHLLEHTHDKAKAWADLCLARDGMKGLD